MNIQFFADKFDIFLNGLVWGSITAVVLAGAWLYLMKKEKTNHS